MGSLLCARSFDFELAKQLGNLLPKLLDPIFYLEGEWAANWKIQVGSAWATYGKKPLLSVLRLHEV